MDKTQAAAAVFDKYAEQYQDKFMAYGPYVESYERFNRLLSSNTKRVLDVACGPGNIAKFLLDRHPQLDLQGFDLSPRMVELAAANNPRARFEVRDCRELSDLAGAYQAIICGFCLPYLSPEEVEKLILCFHDLLSNKGLLYVSFMAGEESQSGYTSGDSRDSIFTHYHEAGRIEQLLLEKDFRIVEHFFSPYAEGEGEIATDTFFFAQLERE